MAAANMKAKTGAAAKCSEGMIVEVALIRIDSLRYDSQSLNYSLCEFGMVLVGS